MKVLKFGGTSVGKPERMQHIAKLINNGDRKVVVLSALSGTTNALVKISNFLYNHERHSAREFLKELGQHYYTFVESLYQTDEAKTAGHNIVKEHFETIERIIDRNTFANLEERIVLSQGELMSTKIFYRYLVEQQIEAKLLPALDFMRVNEHGEPLFNFAKTHLLPILSHSADCNIFVTQGYIALNLKDEVDNLRRGGSDYTASFIGAVTQSTEIQIWTDIDGIHNNDPRIVKNTRPVPEISFMEAAELAYFGAKILHPSSVLPAQKYNIPVRLLNTMKPEAPGTVITNQVTDVEGSVKAIAAKDGITAIKIRSSRMLLTYGFLTKVFEIFERFRTPIDMITTSEVAVSLTIDNDTFINEIENELSQYASVTVDQAQTIICIVGHLVTGKKDVTKKVFDALENVPIRMISYGGSDYNISVLVATKHKQKALESLNTDLFKQ